MPVEVGVPTTINNAIAELGIVIIGRNEGERLVRCLRSLQGWPAVYVDSGSTDQSVAEANAAGVEVVELDLSRPFTAARARNTGFAALIKHLPSLKWVMFVDGDCEVQPQWLEKAVAAAEADSGIAVVCGRRRELYPHSSIYNSMCDIEWNTAAGISKACGGDALYRVAVFQQVGGFDDTFIAGEEPELCFRIRQLGFKILRLEEEMTLHDANITRFQQWWKRTERSGHAYLLNFLKHGQTGSERFKYKELRSIFVWFGIYILLFVAIVPMRSLAPLLLLAALIVAQALKMTVVNSRIRNGYGFKTTFLYSLFIMFGKIPQAFGVMRAYLNHRKGRAHVLVEYK